MIQYNEKAIAETIEYIENSDRQEWANEITAKVLELVRAKADSTYKNCEQITDYMMVREICGMFPQ
jgi:hypothetical protein